MRALVAGGAGFIGSHLCDQLLTDGHSVVAVDNFLSGRPSNVAHLVDHPRFTLVEHDVTHSLLALDLFGDAAAPAIDTVFHLASPASPSDFLRIPLEILDVGSNGTRNLLEVARHHGARFLLASTSEVYGDPLTHPQPETYFGNVDCIGPRSCYDESKRFAEALTVAYRRVHDVNTTMVRIFNTYGPRMRVDDGRVMVNFIVQALSGEPVTLHGEGSQTRSYCFVSDLVAGLVAVAERGGEGPYNLGNPVECSVRELAEQVVSVTGSSSPIVVVPLPAERAGDPQRRRPDISRISRDVQWSPTVDLADGMRTMISAVADELALPAVNVSLPKVRVVVVNFDGGAVTLRCIDSLLASEYPNDLLEIVVVDNASVDGLNWTLREQYPQVVLIQSDVNEGFARGCNLAMRDLDGVDYVALINNDAVVSPGWLQPLLAGFSGPKVGAVCPKLLLNIDAHALMFEPDSLATLPGGRQVGVRVKQVFVNGVDRTMSARFDERFWSDRESRASDLRGAWSKGLASVWWPAEQPIDEVEVWIAAAVDGTARVGPPAAMEQVAVSTRTAPVRRRLDDTVRIINSAGGALYRGWFGGDRGFMEPDVGQYDTPQEIFAWCGGAVLLSAEYLSDVGLFDPSYFLYYEDFDLSWRGRSSGWTYRYEPASVVFHEHAYSSNAGSPFFTFWVDRNRRLTLIKNAPAQVALRAAAGSLVAFARDLVRHTYQQARRKRPPSPRVVKARVANLWKFVGALPGALRSRRRLNKARVVSHDDISQWMVDK